MKDLIRKILFFILYYLGIGFVLKKNNTKNKLIPVLLFHRVSNDNDKYWEPIKPEYFEKIIKFLSKKYSFISISDLLEKKVTDFNNKCIITFDDGYKDFILEAFPIIKKYKIPITFFITSKSITENKIIWTSELNYVIKNTDKISIIIEGKEYSLRTENDKLQTANDLLFILKNKPNHIRIELLNKIKSELNYIMPKDISMLTWEDIKQMSNVIDIQSHSVSHPMMTNLKKQELEYELKVSKNETEKNINKKISYFSYPIGDYNKSVIDETKKYYKCAFVVGDKMLDAKKISDLDYLYKLPRINITDKNIYELFFRINGFHLLLKKIM